MDRWKQQGQAFTGELHLQLGRLKSLGLLGPEGDRDTAVCPMCARPLEEPDASSVEITTLTRQLSQELDQAQSLQPIRGRGGAAWGPLAPGRWEGGGAARRGGPQTTRAQHW
ncbi:hypothetical protein ACIP98_41850 [Streptomyces sp. NPDC088354]|uniref:hypothetical protein n=1 Tax=Streptomyces sp. NPDC088354 TaxID=3365856 RepID=UPI003813A327